MDGSVCAKLSDSILGRDGVGTKVLVESVEVVFSGLREEEGRYTDFMCINPWTGNVKTCSDTSVYMGSGGH